jgi:quercetin dioxygenase-like cupin family protein
MGDWTSGNALADGGEHRGWLIGHFMDPGTIRHSQAVEVKWAFHPGGEERPEWVTGETATTLLVLVSGAFEIELSEGVKVLADQGDYAMWGPGVDHSWRALEDSVVVTVRWPSTTRS